jgi:hypothetical protein
VKGNEKQTGGQTLKMTQQRPVVAVSSDRPVLSAVPAAGGRRGGAVRREKPGRRLGGRPFLAAALLLATVGCATVQSRWEETRTEGTITAYEAFILEYPQDEEAVQAREILAGLYRQRDWEEAAGQDRISAYEAFIAKHPEGKQAREARARLRALRPPPLESPAQQSIAKDDLFSDAFLKRHQQGLLMAAEPGEGEKEEIAFAEAARGGTIPAYEAFLRRYPSGARTGEAGQRLEALYFKQAQNEDTVAAYERYLQRYPQGTFAGQARSQREYLASRVIMTPKGWANVRAGRTVKSAITGKVQAGDLVRTDFLRDGWYAIFSLTEKDRSEEKALGYVHASLLIPASARQGVSRPPADGEKQHPTLPPEAAPDPPVRVKNIVFEDAGDGRELLLIEFDRPYLPVLSSGEGEIPRILIELRNAHPIPPQWAAVDTGGRLIRRIRSRTDQKARSARIVLEMDPTRNYSVHPVYYEQNHAYVLEISEVK